MKIACGPRGRHLIQCGRTQVALGKSGHPTRRNRGIGLRPDAHQVNENFVRGRLGGPAQKLLKQGWNQAPVQRLKKGGKTSLAT